MKAILSIGLALGVGSAMNLAYGQQAAGPQSDSCHATLKNLSSNQTADLDISFDRSASGQMSMAVVDKGPSQSEPFALSGVQETESAAQFTDEDIQDMNTMIVKLGGQPLDVTASDITKAHWETGEDERPGNTGLLYTILELYGKDGQPVAKLGGMAILIIPLLVPCQ